MRTSRDISACLMKVELWMGLKKFCLISRMLEAVHQLYLLNSHSHFFLNGSSDNQIVRVG